jgi:hypothetical protein
VEQLLEVLLGQQHLHLLVLQRVEPVVHDPDSVGGYDQSVTCPHERGCARTESLWVSVSSSSAESSVSSSYCRGCARTESLWVSVSSSSAESSVSSSYCEFSDAGSCDDSSVAPSFDLVSGLCRSIRSGSESFFSDSEICFLPRLIVLSPTVLL